MDFEWPEQEMNIPLPETEAPRSSKYRWEEMKIGASVFFKGDSETCKKHNQSVHAYGSKKRTKLDEHGNRITGLQEHQFVTKKMDGGIRIWRKS